MLLRRIYKRDAQGEMVRPVALDGVEVRHTGLSREQRFSTRLVAAGLNEGWITIRDGALLVHTRPEALRYTIVRVPGRYVSESGVEVIQYYECVLDADQHARWSLKAKGEDHG